MTGGDYKVAASSGSESLSAVDGCWLYVGMKGDRQPKRNVVAVVHACVWFGVCRTLIWQKTSLMSLPNVSQNLRKLLQVKFCSCFICHTSVPSAHHSVLCDIAIAILSACLERFGIVLEWPD